jgi:hypothetical protein
MTDHNGTNTMLASLGGHQISYGIDTIAHDLFGSTQKIVLSPFGTNDVLINKEGLATYLMETDDPMRDVRDGMTICVRGNKHYIEVKRSFTDVVKDLKELRQYVHKKQLKQRISEDTSCVVLSFL